MPTIAPQRTQFPGWRRSFQVVNVDSGVDATTAASFATDSIAFANGRSYLLSFSFRGSGGGAVGVDTVSGGGLTWTLMAVSSSPDAGGGSIHDLYLYEGYAASGASTGAVTITTTPIASQGITWVVDQADRRVSEVQQDDNFTLGVAFIDLTLAAFTTSTNVAYGVHNHHTLEATTPDTNMFELADATLDHATAAADRTHQTQWKSGEELTVSWSWTTGARAHAIAVELEPFVIRLTPDPITIPLTLTAPTLSFSFVPSPVEIPLVIPAPTVGIEVALTPDPVAIPLTLTTPTLTRVLTPSPVTIPLVIPDPTVTVAGGAITLTPDAVAIPLVIAAPTIDIEIDLAPSPVTIPLVIAAPTIGIEIDLTPSPITIPLVLTDPTISVVTVLTPDPVEILLVVTSPVITGLDFLGTVTIEMSTAAAMDLIVRLAATQGVELGTAASVDTFAETAAALGLEADEAASVDLLVR